MYTNLDKAGRQVVPFVDQFFGKVVSTEDMCFGEPSMGSSVLIKRALFGR